MCDQSNRHRFIGSIVTSAGLPGAGWGDGSTPAGGTCGEVSRVYYAVLKRSNLLLAVFARNKKAGTRCWLFCVLEKINVTANLELRHNFLQAFGPVSLTNSSVLLGAADSC